MHPTQLIGHAARVLYLKFSSLLRKDDTVDKTELAVNTPKSTFSHFQQIQKSVAGTVVKDTTLSHSTFIYTLY